MVCKAHNYNLFGSPGFYGVFERLWQVKKAGDFFRILGIKHTFASGRFSHRTSGTGVKEGNKDTVTLSKCSNTYYEESI